MQKVVRVDSKGRLLLPKEVRDALGIGEGSKLVLRLRSDGVVELIPLEKLYEQVSNIFREKMRGWREEEHEATRLLESLVGGSSGDR